MSDFGFASVNYPHYPLSTFIVLFGVIFSITPILLLLIPYRLIRLVSLSNLVGILVTVNTRISRRVTIVTQCHNCDILFVKMLELGSGIIPKN